MSKVHCLFSGDSQGWASRLPDQRVYSFLIKAFLVLFFGRWALSFSLWEKKDGRFSRWSIQVCRCPHLRVSVHCIWDLKQATDATSTYHTSSRRKRAMYGSLLYAYIPGFVEESSSASFIMNCSRLWNVSSYILRLVTRTYYSLPANTS